MGAKSRRGFAAMSPEHTAPHRQRRRQGLARQRPRPPLLLRRSPRSRPQRRPDKPPGTQQK
ncbi:MAG: hypothetical protein WKG07_15990 [Hymenobacter sp.]